MQIKKHEKITFDDIPGRISAFAQAQTQKAHKTPEQKAQRMTKALKRN
jgi:hypothetical protein